MAMGGAVPMTSLGTGYVVGKGGPRVQVRETLGRFQVLVLKRGGTWAEIVAETKTRDMADALVRYLWPRPRKPFTETPTKNKPAG
jgi:hypothetical protein